MNLEAFAHAVHTRPSFSDAEKEAIRQAYARDGSYTIRSFFSSEDRPGIYVGVHDRLTDFDMLKHKHQHDFFEMIYVYRGCFTSHMADQSILLSEGDFLLIPPGILHAPEIIDSSDIVFNLLFNVAYMRSCLAYHRGTELMYRYFSDFLSGKIGPTSYLHFQQVSEETKMKAHLLIHEHAQKAPCYDLVAGALLLSLLLSLGREHKLPDTFEGTAALSGAEIISYIEQHAADVSLTSMAAAYSYSPGHLSRLITGATGQAFSELVAQARLEKARRLLCESPSCYIEDVARTVGFSSAAAFSRFFQSRMQMSPSAFRQSLRPPEQPPSMT